MNRHFAFLSMVALAGCNSQPAPLTQTEYFNKYAQAMCDGLSPACLMIPATCTAGRLAECQGDAQIAATNGWDFLPPNADAYLRKVSAAYGKVKQGSVITAKDYKDMEEARGKVYRGTGLANKGTCLADADCLDGLICDKGRCGNEKTVAQGAPCANIGETCPQNFFCGDSGGGVLLCVTKVGLGGACTDAPCLENLRCTAGFCAMQLDFGQACTLDQDCSSGFCEPYAGKCALDIRFAPGNFDCIALGGPSS